jgi:NADH-quinone oxidoreductase subunit G
LPYFAVATEGSTGLQAVPLHHLFGSEELSGQAPVMASRIPGVYIAMNPATAAKARLKDGAAAKLSYNGSAVTLPVKVKAELPDNCVGIPAGLPGVPAIEPGIGVKVEAA